MKNLGAKWLALAAISAAVAGMGLNGCGGGDDGTGTAGKGGTTGSAGKGGTTGTAGKGGTTGTGGSSAGTGGSSAGTTGTAGTGGATAGTTGSGGGGTTGGGGTNGAVGGQTGCPALAMFDSTNEGFAQNIYNTGPTNLALLEGGAPANLVVDANNGSPTVGSLRSDAPFSDFKQFIDVQKGYATTDLKNWTGYKLHVRVKIASGLNTDATQPNGVQPYVSSYNGVDGGTPNYHFKGTYTSSAITNRAWTDYVVDVSTASGDFDPSKVVNFGVLIQSGDGTATATKPTAAVIYIDSFWLEGSCAGTGTGGTGGGTGGTGGAAGTGGSTGTGGAAGHGGTGGGGGVGGVGGVGGIGGTTGVGGVGGTTGVGGIGGTTGVGGIGGTTGVGGAAGHGGTGGSAGTTGSAGTGGTTGTGGTSST